MRKDPIIDFHCDLLSYLATIPDSTPHDTEGLGCAIPFLQAGHVGIQVCAMYTDRVPESPELARQQAEIFQALPEEYPEHFAHYHAFRSWDEALQAGPTALMASVESATGILNEEAPLREGEKNLDRLIALTGGLAYVGITHHRANRFGGGNYERGPLTDDGKVLVDWLAERRIPIDFSHASDALAYGVVEYLEAKNYDLPLLASHSNYRELLTDERNLPDELVQEIVKRGGVIGINFLRKYLHPTDSEGFFNHLAHGQKLGATAVFGADFFYGLDMPTYPERKPFYLPEHEDASKYPELLPQVADRFSEHFAQDLAYGNGLAFLKATFPL